MRRLAQHVALSSDRGGQAPLAIERADELIEIDELALQLDHQDGPRGRVPGQDVDDPALAVHGERDLRRQLPAGKREDPPRDQLVEGRVSRAPHPVQIAAAPATDEIDPQLERGRDRPQGGERARAEMTALDP
jgi:hypothetical protein